MSIITKFQLFLQIKSNVHYFLLTKIGNIVQELHSYTYMYKNISSAHAVRSENKVKGAISYNTNINKNIIDLINFN